MDHPDRKPLRPLRLSRSAIDRGGEPRRVLPVSDGIPKRALAPDWISPTEDNGLSAPRAELHIALTCDGPDAERILKNGVRVIKPPLWHGGKIYTHIIRTDKLKKSLSMDIQILQAVADLGWLDAVDLEIGPPEAMTDGYPSGVAQ